MIGEKEKFMSGRDTEEEAVYREMARVAAAETVINKTDLIRINIWDFANDPYAKKEIAADEAEVKKRQGDFDNDIEHLSAAEVATVEKRKKISEAVEVIVCEGAENREWFGADAHSVRTSEYDDIKNGVDLVIEFENEDEQPEHLALSIDITTTGDTAILERKMKRCRERIKDHRDENRCQRVKYFQSPKTDYKGPLIGIAPVVVGLSGENAFELLELRAQSIRLGGNKAISAEHKKQIRENEEKLNEHPVQVIFLQQILWQLEKYLNLLDKKDERDQAFYEKIDNVVNAIYAALNEKKNIDTTELEKDKSHQKIKELAAP